MAEMDPSRWATLRLRRAPQSWEVEPVAPDRLTELVGIDPTGRLHLLLGITTEPLSLPPDLQSIEVRTVEREALYLDVSARSHHEDLFTMFVNKVLHAVGVEGRDRAVAVRSTLDDLRAAFRPVAPALGPSEQVGLYGELWVLLHVLFPTLGARACDIWSGPLGERHDFAGIAVHLEVKTTTRSEGRHEVSRIDQLRAPPAKRLLLASLSVTKSIGGSSTVAELVDTIVERLGSNGRALDDFDARLRGLGWSDGLRQSGELVRLDLASARIFEVIGDFPRLPDDYEAPRGVTGIRYAIDLAGRPELSKVEVEQILREM